jgi:hypothetical protein
MRQKNTITKEKIDCIVVLKRTVPKCLYYISIKNKLTNFTKVCPNAKRNCSGEGNSPREKGDKLNTSSGGERK